MELKNDKRIIEKNYNDILPLVNLGTFIILSFLVLGALVTTKTIGLDVGFYELVFTTAFLPLVLRLIVLKFIASRYSDIDTLKIDEQSNRLHLEIQRIDSVADLFIYHINKIYKTNGVLYIACEVYSFATCKMEDATVILNLDKDNRKKLEPFLKKLMDRKE